MFAARTKRLAPMPAGRRTPARSAPLGVVVLETREVPAGLSADWVRACPEPPPAASAVDAFIYFEAHRLAESSGLEAPPESPVSPAGRGYDLKLGPKL